MNLELTSKQVLALYKHLVANYSTDYEYKSDSDSGYLQEIFQTLEQYLLDSITPKTIIATPDCVKKFLLQEQAKIDSLKKDDCDICTD